MTRAVYERLDQLVGRMTSATEDRAPDDLEVGVLLEIARRRAVAKIVSALTPVRIASIILILTVGILIGAAFASRAPSAYASELTLAPSTLLEGR